MGIEIPCRERGMIGVVLPFSDGVHDLRCHEMCDQAGFIISSEN